MESRYLKIIKVQEDIIKRLEKSAYFYIFGGYCLGILTSLLIYILLK
jgi:hypothetical protein